MIRRRIATLVCFIVLSFMPAIASAQGTTPSNVKGAPWVVVGGASSTLLADCSDC